MHYLIITVPSIKPLKRKRNISFLTGAREGMPLIHECPTCGKKWRTRSELNKHTKTHSDLRPFVCEICGQGYRTKTHLLVHVGMHNGIHPFTCHFCNKSFTQKTGLERHLTIHNNEKKHQVSGRFSFNSKILPF
jgi:Zinc finger, C2H2 type.